MSLPPDLVEMLGAFEGAGVRYLIIGGHAVSLHARPRTTKDLDVWLDARPENVRKACGALRGFGVPAEIVEALRTADPDDIVWLGRVPSRVDFLLRVAGLTFDAAWKRRVTAEVGGVSAQFVGRDDLLANKRRVGRPQDLRDVRAIERARASDAGQRPLARKSRPRR